MLTKKVMADFIGLAAVIINEELQQEFLIIGMDGMAGNHIAENIKEAIENLVNRYKFNKRLVHGKKQFNYYRIMLFCGVTKNK